MSLLWQGGTLSHLRFVSYRHYPSSVKNAWTAIFEVLERMHLCGGEVTPDVKLEIDNMSTNEQPPDGRSEMSTTIRVGDCVFAHSLASPRRNIRPFNIQHIPRHQQYFTVLIIFRGQMNFPFYDAGRFALSFIKIDITSGIWRGVCTLEQHKCSLKIICSQLYCQV